MFTVVVLRVSFDLDREESGDISDGPRGLINQETAYIQVASAHKPKSRGSGRGSDQRRFSAMQRKFEY
jgi:hypothetical protein